jgi:hypothetical protein
VRLRAGLALGALLAAGLLAGCGGDGEESNDVHPNDPFYGVISAEPLPGAPTFARLGRGGIGTLRVNLAWGYVQAGPGAPYDWSHYDRVVGDAARNGIRVLATVYSSPAWVEAAPEDPPLGRALPEFEAFARAAVTRYGADGSFWSEHPDLPKLPITNWQLWNEPNFNFFWKPAPDTRQYLELLRAFHSAVKKADPEAKVLLGGLFPTPRDGLSLESFLSALYRAGAAPLFDATAIHPYAATPDDALQRVAELRALMRRFGDAEKPIWITEVGWASGGAPSGLTVGPTRQARYLSRTFNLATERREQLGIAGVVWYSLRDTPGPYWPGHCGLFELDGTPKPSWGTLAAVAGGRA